MSETPNAQTPPEPAPELVAQPAAEPAISSLPPENRTRGTLFALAVIPAGIILWVIIWMIGFIAAIVGILVAVGALWLYRKGSGGRIGYNGAARVSAIVVVTLLVSFFAGLIADSPAYYGRALASGKFFEAVSYSLGLAGTDGLINIGLLAVFIVLGVGIVFRTAMQQVKQEQAERAAGQLPG